jgi:hypothetical protein
VIRRAWIRPVVDVDVDLDVVLDLDLDLDWDRLALTV